MSDEQRVRGLVDGRRFVGVLARVVAGMNELEFDQWRLGQMLDRNYVRNRFGIGGSRG